MWTWRELAALFARRFGQGCGARRIEREGFTIYRSVRRQPDGAARGYLADYQVVAPGGLTTTIRDPGITLQAQLHDRGPQPTTRSWSAS